MTNEMYINTKHFILFKGESNVNANNSLRHMNRYTTSIHFAVYNKN